MNQRLLTTFSIVAIKHFEKDDFFYLGNKSFISNSFFTLKEVKYHYQKMSTQKIFKIHFFM
jgi:hypothetical protein